MVELGKMIAFSLTTTSLVEEYWRVHCLKYCSSGHQATTVESLKISLT